MPVTRDEQLRAGLERLASGVQPMEPLDAWETIQQRSHGELTRARHPALMTFAAVAVAAGLLVLLASMITTGDDVGVKPKLGPTTPSAAVPDCASDRHALPCDPGDGNLQLTDKVVVAEGDDASGRHWQLEAYRSETGLCLDLRRGAGATGGCRNTSAESALASAGYSGFGFADGIVRADVARVRIELTDGTARDVPIITNAGFEARFFVAELPPDTTPTRFIAIDERGTEIERLDMPPQSTQPQS